jgi:predicted permease
MFRDLRTAYRTLRQNPVFTLTAIVSIALAIGANSAIFSFQDALLFRPLAVKNPSSLVTVNSRTSVGTFEGFPYADVVDLRDKNRSFDGLVAYRALAAGVARDEKTQPQFKLGLLVTGNFFDVLGVVPHMGRTFQSDEDTVPGRDPVVVLAYEFWQNEFNSDPSIVGGRIRIGRSAEQEFTVIGVAPESFTGMDQFIRPAFYVPVMMGPKVLGVSNAIFTDRKQPASEDRFAVKALLKAGTSIEAANADVVAIAKSLEEIYPDSHRARSAAVRTEMQSRLDAIPVLGGVVASVSVVMILILLIACANVMNLMLSRGRTRAREIAIRLSLGASGMRVIRQLMAESLIIALAGGALGLVIAGAAVQFFSEWELPGDAPIKFGFQLDQRVLLFTAVVAVLSAILFGLAPAWRSVKTDLTTALKWHDTAGGRRRWSVRSALVAIQITGSIVLVMAAVQMSRNTSKAVLADPGFAVQHRLAVRLDPSVAGYSAAVTRQFYRTLLERARETPGVQSAALGGAIPFTTDILAARVAPEGFELPPGLTGVTSRADIVDEDFFKTMGMPILAGRGFLASDQENSTKVAVVNEAFAQRLFKGNALGKRVRLAIEDETWVEVVGVSATAKYQGVVEPPAPFLYMPFAQRPRARMNLIVETASDAAAIAPQMREVIRSIDPRMPIFSVRTLEDVFQRNGVMVIRIIVLVFGATAFMGLFLALVGLYGVVSYQVTRRTREIGIRMALGAERVQVMTMIVRQSAIVAVVAIAIGLVLSVVVRPALLNSMGRPTTGGTLSGFDPELFVGVPLALFLITVFAALIPARRAAHIDPQKTLRQE